MAASPLAAAYPERPIKFVVPFPPGGALDAIARVVGPKVSESLKQPVVIENRAGAGGAVGAEAVAKSPPDGYTIFIGSASTHGTNSAAGKLPYDPVKDFSPVALLCSTPFVLVAHPSVPANTVRELVAYAKANPRALNVGSFGSGGSNHLAAELFKAMAGVDMVHVPYKGAGPAMADLLAGRVQVVFDTFPSSNPHLAAGRIKLLGVGGKQRASLRPEAPTISESGVPGYEAGSWFAIFGPAGMPAEAVRLLNQRFLEAVKLPDVRERFAALGLEPLSSTPDELRKLVVDEVNKWQTLVRERNLKFD